MMKPNSLSAAREAVATARAQHQADLAALTIAGGRVAEAREACERFDSATQAAIDRQARRLEAAARAGNSGPLPALATDKQLTEEIAARRNLQSAQQAESSLATAERASAAVIAEAEEALDTAAIVEYGERHDQLAREVMADDSALEAKKIRLRAGLDAVANFKPSITAYRALRDTVNMPVNELSPTGDWDKSWNTPINARDRPPIDDRQYWTDLLQRLLSGDGVAA